MEHKIKAIWHWNYFDGPINGLALLGTQKVWFTVKEMGGEEVERLFTVHSIPLERLEELESEIERFRKEIGYSNEHDQSLYKQTFISVGTRTFKWKYNLEHLRGEPLFEVSKSEIENYSLPRSLIF